MSLTWQTGTVVAVHQETESARALDIEVPGWTGNLAGQHLDLRLTAPDGYTATRSYSLASAGTATRIQLAVDRLPDGEVSPYLVDDVALGDPLEIRGPLGGWFIWRPEESAPIQLIAGGSGVVPLMAMLRAHKATGSLARFRLLYSVRSPRDVFFAAELAELSSDATVDITWVYTRETPAGWPVPAGRASREVIAASSIPASDSPLVFVCGPTGFVEAVADVMVALGHQTDRVKTERFGGN